MSNRIALASRLGVKPGQLARLFTLAEAAAKAMELECSEDNAPDSKPKTDAVEDYAKTLGYGVMWPGLYPILTKDGNQIHIY